MNTMRSRILMSTVCALCRVIIAVSAISRFGWCDFNDIGLGARPTGMGSAFTGMADDVHAMYYNPAGLAFIHRPELSAEYSRLYLGLDDDSNLSKSFIGYVYPIKMSKDKNRYWRTKSVDAVQLPYRDYGTVGVGITDFNLTGEYEERTVYISYGKRVQPGLAIGLNIKNLYEKYSIDDYLRHDPVFNYGNHNSLQTISVDTAVLYRLTSLFSFGAMIMDINRPDVGLKSVNRLDRQYRLGTAYRMRSFNAALDITRQQDVSLFHAGLEQWLLDRRLAVRAGYIQGSREVKNYSLGMSVNLFDIQLDYAFLCPLAGLKDIDGSHRMTFIIRFGFENREQMTDTLGEAFIKIQREHEELTEQYNHAEQMKSKLEEKYIEDITIQQEQINDLKNRQKQLEKELEERPYKVVNPKPVKRPPPPPTYVVQEGDTLRSIAEKLYGDPLRWIDLYYANQDNIKRSAVETGQVLVVPR